MTGASRDVGRVHEVSASVTDSVRVTWVDSEGRSFIKEYLAPPAATREAVFRAVEQLEIDVPEKP